MNRNCYLSTIAVTGLILFFLNGSISLATADSLEEAVPAFTSINFESTSVADRTSFEELHGNDSEKSYLALPDYESVSDDESASDSKSTTDSESENGSEVRYGEGPIKHNIAFLWSRILLKSAGIPEENHFLLRHNLSCYLAQGGSSYRLLRLYNHAKWNESLHFSSLQLHPRFEFKLIRELKTPYTDEEVVTQIIKLESQVREVFTAVKEADCGKDFTLFAVGSYSKGRIGANSDLDSYFITNNDLAREKILELPFAKADLNTEAEVNFMVQPKITKFLLGESVCLGDGESFEGMVNPMVEIYGAVLSNNFGIIMSRDKSSNIHYRYSTDSTEDKLWKRETNKLLEATWRVFSDLRHIAGNVATWAKERISK